MRYRVFALTIALTAILAPALAQDRVALDPETGARLGLELDKKLSRGLHLTLEEEARFDNSFASFDRLQTTIGLSYKLHPMLKLGVGYSLIAPYSQSATTFKSLRHRAILDAKLTYKTGRWSLSLKERLQFTYRSGDMNIYQSPRTVITLKSRLKAQYRASARLTPYAYVEMRQMLNAYSIAANITPSGEYVDDDLSEESYAGWFISGRTAYLNRLRASVGATYKLDSHSTLTAYLLADRTSDRVVDANAEGSKLKSYTYETGFVGQIGLAYTYNF